MAIKPLPQAKNHAFHSGFTLIEIIVACSILGVVVFAVLRMTTNNMHQAQLIEQDVIQNQTAANIETCIRSIGYPGLTPLLGGTGAINFGSNNNECKTDGGNIITVNLKNGENITAPITIENEFSVNSGSTLNSYKIKLTTTTEKNSQIREFSVFQ